MVNFKVVAFDCDGVLFDTEQANRVYYSNILQHFGRPAVTDEQFVFVHMHTVFESLAHLFPDEKTLTAAHVFPTEATPWIGCWLHLIWTDILI